MSTQRPLQKNYAAILAERTNGLTFREIGSNHNVSRQRIQQITKKAKLIIPPRLPIDLTTLSISPEILERAKSNRSVKEIARLTGYSDHLIRRWFLFVGIKVRKRCDHVGIIQEQHKNDYAAIAESCKSMTWEKAALHHGVSLGTVARAIRKLRELENRN